MPPGSAIPNPTKRKVRPSTASANLQSHPTYSTSLYGNGRPSTALPSLSRPKTKSGPRQYVRTPQTPSEEVDIKPQRRLTLANVDGIAEKEDFYRGTNVNKPSVGAVLKGKIEEKIGLDTLEKLKRAFELADVDGSGELELDEFKLLLKQQLNISNQKEKQIDALFNKIDWSNDGAITWDEFCTYMQLEYSEKEESYQRSKEVSFVLPAAVKKNPHREPVLRITDSSDGSFMACSQDGIVSFWTPSVDFKRKRTVQTNEAPIQKNQKTKWITDFTIMSDFNKLLVSTGDREIQFFELSSFEPYCQINSLETVPLRLDYCLTGPDECMLLFGDSDGCVNIIVITSAGECLRTWKAMPKIKYGMPIPRRTVAHNDDNETWKIKAPKTEGIASVSIDLIASGDKTQFIRWKVHGDWVQQLKYYHELRQVISCSNHESTALVIGCTMGSTDVSQQLREIRDQKEARHTDKDHRNPKDREKDKLRDLQQRMAAKPRLPTDETVFTVYKGVKCFDFNKEKNLLVTGGMDRIVRIWNPYVNSKPIGMLRGHNKPIFYIFIAADEERVFSISTDKCIKVWESHDQSCLLTVRPKAHQIRGDLQACHYSTASKMLFVATDQINALPLKLKPKFHADIVITHKEQIHAVVYNPVFKQVITCSDESQVKVWDFETGSAIFEFNNAHDDHAITCLQFDNSGRRLLTGGRDGRIRIWNYNNGHCLRTMMKPSNNEEVCDLTYIEMNKNRYVISVGWDKQINIYTDTVQDTGVHTIQYPLERWHDDVQQGHREDILSVCQCPPNLLATGSYDGEVIVWNMVSGHIFCHLRSPTPPGKKDNPATGEMAVNKVLFLRTRVYQKEGAQLIASGPRGEIHLWNIYHGGRIMAQFNGSKEEDAMITTMEINKANTQLFCGDNFGFIYVWNMDQYCINGTNDSSPELIQMWRGHVENVTDMTMVEENKVLITSSLDCTVRMWTFDGEFVGTFGQQDPWDIYNKTTFQHPMVPYDVLVDPLSLPDHPVIAEKHNVHDIVHEDSARNSDDESNADATTVSHISGYQKEVFYVDDNTIAEQLQARPYSHGTGKRLRHEKMRPMKVDRGGPSEYQMLRYYELEATPQPAPPKLTVAKDDPYNFVMAMTAADGISEPEAAGEGAVN